MSEPVEHVLESLRAEIDLVEFISGRVELEQRGDSHVGDCPFCAEPKALHVSEEHKFFHCFKCKASGDLFSYVMRTEGMSLPDAVKYLSSWVCP